MEAIIQRSGGEVIATIEREVMNLAEGEVNLNRGYARLAGLLVICKMNECWRDVGHASFNAYLLSLKEKYNRSTQMLYAYVSVAEKLLPAIGEEALDKMGITKAMEIVKAAGRAKKSIPPVLIQAALDSKNDVAKIRALAHVLLELGDNQVPKGRYIDLGGFYADSEQDQTMKDAWRISVRVLGLPPEMSDAEKRRRVWLFWAQEINGTYAAEAFGLEQEASAN